MDVTISDPTPFILTFVSLTCFTYLTQDEAQKKQQKKTEKMAIKGKGE